MNDIMKDYAMITLCRQINESDFTKLEVTKVDEGLSVSLAGQTFGIIGALGVAVADLCEGSEMSIEEAITFVHMSAELAVKCRDEGCKHSFETKEQMLNFMKKMFNKEGDK